MAGNKVGRPSTYTQELADQICAELAEGKSLRTVCAAKGMPALSSIFKWMREHEEFSKQYASAKQEAADALADEVLYISDTPMMGEVRTIKPDGTIEIKQDEMLGHRRLQIDTRKWLMAKMKPKLYGDKVDVTSDGEKIGTVLSADQADQLIRARALRDSADI